MNVTAFEVIGRDQTRIVYALDAVRRFVVGRSTLADLSVQDPNLEDRHFEIYRVDHVKGPVYYLNDLSCTGETRILGERVTNVRLTAGAAIQAGGSSVRIVEGSAEQVRPFPVRSSGNHADMAPVPPVPNIPPALPSPAPTPSDSELQSLRDELSAAQELIAELNHDLETLCEDQARERDRLTEERARLMEERNRLMEERDRAYRELAKIHNILVGTNAPAKPVPIHTELVGARR